MALSDRLPFARAWLNGRETLRRAVDNSFWLLADQVVRLGAAFVVGVWMARHFGPENYGWFNYSVATVGIISALTTGGINAIVVRNLVRDPAQERVWLGTALLIRGIASGGGFLVCVAIASQQSGPANLLVPIIAAGLLLQVPEVADLLFQARSEARVAAKVRMIACVLATAVKVLLLLMEAPLLWFAIAGVLEIALAAVGWWRTSQSAGVPMRTWRFAPQVLRDLVHASWPIALSGLAVSAQAYGDQLVLGALVGGEQVGQYTAALRIVTVFGFIPMIVHTVAAPEIARAKRDNQVLYRRRLHALYRTMFGIFLLTAIPLMAFGPVVARWLYGAAYEGAITLLPWMALRLLFTNFGVARSIFLTNEDLFRFALVTAAAGAVINISLNLALVPVWGAGGAVAASLVSFGVTTFALEVFEPRARANLRLMLAAILTPWRRFVA